MLEARGLSKEYPTPQGPLQILKDVSFEFSKGDAVSIMGPSGGGKSTLLFLLGALEPPTRGLIRLGGENPFELTPDALAAFRNEKVGFVFQDHSLLPQLSVIENVLTPTLIAPRGDYAEKAKALLEQVGLSERLSHRPSELSGGEKQRVAIARALVRDPELLLCDEPTGNLDDRTAESVAALLLDLDRRQDRILIVVTHDHELASQFPTRMELKRGELVRRDSP